MFTLLNPQALWLSLLALVCLGLPRLARWRRGQLARGMGTPDHEHTYLKPLPESRYRWKAGLLAVFIVAASLCLARPTLQNVQEQFEAHTANVVLLIDNSRSMRACDTDEQKTRMSVALDSIRQKILPVLGTNRLAVIVFAGEAKTLMYLDDNRPVVMRAIELGVRPENAPGDGSALGDAFKLAFDHIDGKLDVNGQPVNGEKTPPKRDPSVKNVIVLLSDGGTDDKTNYRDIVTGCAERQAQLLVFGYGSSAPAQIPISELSEEDQRDADKNGDGKFYKSVDEVTKQRTIAKTWIDEGLLLSLVEPLKRTQSVYVHVGRAADAGFPRLVTGVEMRQRTTQRELFYYPLCACLLALLGAYLCTTSPASCKPRPAQSEQPLSQGATS